MASEQFGVPVANLSAVAASPSSYEPVHPRWRPWAARPKKAAAFHGSPTHRLRKALAKSLAAAEVAKLQPAARQAAVRGSIDFSLKWAYGKPNAALRDWSDLYAYQGVLAVRGQSASLRDRLLLLSGATIFARAHPLTEAIGAAQGMTPAQVDDFFRAAAAL